MIAPPAHDHTSCVSDAMARAEATCRARGAKLTAIRRRVLELVWESHDPVKAYDLLERMRAEGWSSAPSLVYRALGFLAEMGLVHHLASRNAYVGCQRGGETHCAQFFVCERCGAVTEFEDDRLAARIQEAADRSGFAAQGSVVEIRGCCTRCVEAGR